MFCDFSDDLRNTTVCWKNRCNPETWWSCLVRPARRMGKLRRQTSTGTEKQKIYEKICLQEEPST